MLLLSKVETVEIVFAKVLTVLWCSNYRDEVNDRRPAGKGRSIMHDESSFETKGKTFKLCDIKHARCQLVTHTLCLVTSGPKQKILNRAGLCISYYSGVNLLLQYGHL